MTVLEPGDWAPPLIRAWARARCAHACGSLFHPPWLPELHQHLSSHGSLSLNGTLPLGKRPAYLPSGKVVLHQGPHDLLGRLGSAEVGGDRVTQHPLSIADPA